MNVINTERDHQLKNSGLEQLLNTEIEKNVVSVVVGTDFNLSFDKMYKAS